MASTEPKRQTVSSLADHRARQPHLRGDVDRSAIAPPDERQELPGERPFDPRTVTLSVIVFCLAVWAALFTGVYWLFY